MMSYLSARLRVELPSSKASDLPGPTVQIDGRVDRASPTAEKAEGEARALELREKLELSEALLEKLKLLKQAMKDASGMRDIILKRQSMIHSLQSRVDEKLELRGKARQLELDLQRREREVTDLQAEVVQLNNHHRKSFQQVQDLQ